MEVASPSHIDLQYCKGHTSIYQRLESLWSKHRSMHYQWRYADGHSEYGPPYIGVSLCMDVV